MTDDERAVRALVRRAIGGVLFNVLNFPEKAQSRLLGQNMGPLNERITNAVLDALHRSEVPEPSAEGYAEFESWEQEMFRHQPVLSMADGSIAGCQCIDRVFVKGEDWGTHLASVITARLPEPQGEPSDADAVLSDLVVRLNNEAYGKDDVTWGQVMRRIEGVEAARAALRAAGATHD